MNGAKTIVGVVISLLSIILPAIGADAAFLPALKTELEELVQHIDEVLTGAGTVLALVGVRHRWLKRRWEETGVPPKQLAPPGPPEPWVDRRKD